MAITATEQQNIVKLVVAMFDAAPGSVHLDEIVQLYEANGHNFSALAVSLSQTSAFHSIYGAGLTSQQFATNFLTTLGLEGNQEAINFVLARANAGVNRGQIILEAAIALNNSTSATFADARALLQNKTDVALFYSVDLNIAETDLDVLQGVLDGVTADPASVETKKAELAAIPAQVFVLTTGPDLFTGGTGNDIFHGFVNNNAGEGQTLSSSDILNGAGGTDTLSVIVEDNSDAPLNLNLTGIEVLKVRDMSGQEFQLGAVAGLTSVIADGSSSATTFLNLQNLVEASILNPGAGLQGIELAYDLGNFAATATQKVTVRSTDVGGDFQFLLAHDKDSHFGTYEVVSAGTADNALFVEVDTATETIKVSGTANIELLTHDSLSDNSKLATVDASTLAAGLTFSTIGTEGAMTINGGSGNDVITLDSGLGGTGTFHLDHQIDLGEGDDQLRGEADNRVGSGAVVDGGAGKDTVAVALIDVGNATSFDNFEILDIAGIGTDVAFDAAVVSGSAFTGVAVSGDLGADATVIGTGFSDGLTVTGDPGGFDLTLGFAGVAGTADALGIVFDDADDGTDNDLDFDVLKVNGIETVNITSGGGDAGDTNAIATLSSNTVSTINVTGANDFDLVGITNVTGAGLTSFTKFDASTATGDVGVGISDLVAQQTAGTKANVAYSVLLGSGDDFVELFSDAANTKTTTANVTVTAGGDDIVDVDSFFASTASVGTGTVGSIVNLTGADDGDVIDVFDVASGATLGMAENITGATNTAQAVEVAFAASGAEDVTWFVLGGNTYIGVDVDSDDAYTSADTLVRLTGTVDLSGATYDGNIITL